MIKCEIHEKEIILIDKQRTESYKIKNKKDPRIRIALRLCALFGYKMNVVDVHDEKKGKI